MLKEMKYIILIPWGDMNLENISIGEVTLPNLILFTTINSWQVIGSNMDLTRFYKHVKVTLLEKYQPFVDSLWEDWLVDNVL